MRTSLLIKNSANRRSTTPFYKPAPYLWLFLVVFSSLFFWSCETPTLPPPAVQFTVSFNTDGGSVVSPQTINSGQKASKPTDPKRDGFTFGSWYKESGLITEFNFAIETITADITLYAKWRTATTETRITAFSFSKRVNPGMSLHSEEVPSAGTIDQTAGIITVSASAYIYIANLKPSFTASAGATVSVGTTTQESEVTQQDFTSPLTYRVTSEDGTTIKDYVVTVVRDTLATIPDPNFRSELKKHLSAAFTDDKLNIRHSSLADFITFEYTPTTTDFIESIKGVEFLTALTKITTPSDALSELNVSRNVKLNTLEVNGTHSRVGKLKVLNVSQNTALTTLWCINNQLTKLDVSQNTQLTELYCSFNQLTKLDVSQNTALTRLWCTFNRLEALNVSTNTQLTKLYCRDNQLTKLDVSQNTKLTDLRCSNTQLTKLDVSQNIALIELRCYDNQLTKLDVSQNTALTRLWCSNNQLTKLDVSQNTQLTQLYCFNNQLTVLDMTGMRSVAVLQINGPDLGGVTTNPLTTLKVFDNDVMKLHSEVKKVKTDRDDAVTISTYSVGAIAGTYAVVCTNYNPNTNSCP